MFQDAVRAADSLSIRYIWIDSLCIKQDSKQDWSEQAAQMGSIYKAATVNISATAAENCNVSMFSRRNPLAVTLIYINLSWHGEAMYGGSRKESKECCLLYNDMWETAVDTSHLATRGWIFQERLMSPRIVHFTPTQVFWECRCSHACETVPWGRPYLGSPTSPYDLFFDRISEVRQISRDAEQSFADLLERHGSNDADAAKTEDESEMVAAVENEIRERNERLWEMYKLWADLVEHYSACHFTKTTDRLVALEAARNEMLKIVPEHEVYMDGHWKSELAAGHGLLWQAGIVDERGAVHQQQFTFRHTEGKIAPSWSWASINGPVLPFQHFRTGELLIELTTYEPPNPAAIRGSNYGGIRLKGSVFEAGLGMASGPQLAGGKSIMVVFGDTEGKTNYRFAAPLLVDDMVDFYDRVAEPGYYGDTDMKLFAVPIMWMNEDWVEGLLLEQADPAYYQGFPAFVRIGKFLGLNGKATDYKWGEASALRDDELYKEITVM